jgi:hypothetical protein
MMEDSINRVGLIPCPVFTERLIVRDPYQMHTPKRAESSRARTKKLTAEVLVRSSGLRDTVSPSESHQGEPRQLGEDPPTTLRSFQVENDSQGTSLTEEKQSPKTTLPELKPVLPDMGSPPGGLDFQIIAEGHTQDVIVRIPSGGHSFATSPRNPDHSTPVVMRGPSYNASRATHKGEQADLVHTDRIACDGAYGEEQNTKHDENAQPLMQFGTNGLFAYGEHPQYQDVQFVGMGAAVRGVADLHTGAAQAPSITKPVPATHWCLRDSNSPEMESDDEVDMEVDPSIPMDEDEDEVKVGSCPSFGQLSNTTFDSRVAYQPLPYSQDIEVEQGGIIATNGLEFVEDSAMEEAEEEHREVTAMVTAGQTTLQPSPNMPSLIYSPPPNIQSCASVQTCPLSGGLIHPFQPTMSSDLYTPYRTVPENTGFPQVEPPQDVISLFAPNWAPSSPPQVEAKPLQEQGTALSRPFPAPEPIVAVSHTTLYSTPSLSPPSPSRASSAPTSPPTHDAIGEHKREIEDLSVSIGPLPPAAGIEREGSSLRYVRISLVM